VLSLVKPFAAIGLTGNPGTAVIMTDFTYPISKEDVICFMEMNLELMADGVVFNDPLSIPPGNVQDESLSSFLSRELQ
jgi:hypothetical protein